MEGKSETENKQELKVEDKSEQKVEPKKGILQRAVQWTNEQLFRTIFAGIKLILPERNLNPFSFFGMITFLCGVILTITGIYLMIYYVPSFEGAWNSVAKITDEVPYGFYMRGLHYWASNGMAFFAILHCFYLYFKGRYKLRNKLMWVTGVVMGVVVILEAFTGYNLIMNERAMFASRIAQSLAQGINPLLQNLMMGGGSLSEYILRFYTLHIFVLPLVVAILIMVHFPRSLILDVAAKALVIGGIMMIVGIFPAELGRKYYPTVTAGVTIPEWYLTGIYTFLRSTPWETPWFSLRGIDQMIAGLWLPLIFIALIALMPFIDRSKGFSYRERPVITSLGVLFICQAVLVTIWGNRAYNIIDPVVSESQISIRAGVFWPIFLLSGIIPFSVTYLWLKRGQAVKVPKPSGTRFYLSEQEATILIVAAVVVEAVLNYYAFLAYFSNMKEVAAVAWGAVFILFGLCIYAYRLSKVAPVDAPRSRAISLSFNKAAWAALFLQFFVAATVWFLNPISFVNQKTIAFISAIDLTVFAIVVYSYRQAKGMTVSEDREWLAVGMGMIALFLLFAIFGA